MTSAALGGTGSGGGVLGNLVGHEAYGFTTKPEWGLGLALPFPLL